MAVPQVALALRLADDVRHDGGVRGRDDLLKLGPAEHVLEVKVEVVGFRERVQVDGVDAEQIARAETTRRRHGRGGGSLSGMVWEMCLPGLVHVILAG